MMMTRIETTIEIPGDVRDRIEEIKKRYFSHPAPVTAAYFPDEDKTVFVQVYYDAGIQRQLILLDDKDLDADALF